MNAIRRKPAQTVAELEFNWQAPVSTRGLADHHGERGGVCIMHLPLPWPPARARAPALARTHVKGGPSRPRFDMSEPGRVEPRAYVQQSCRETTSRAL